MRLVIIFAIACLVGGCASTITPDPVTATQPSWDNGEQNSGIIRDLGEGKGWLVTGRFVERYQSRLDRYGKDVWPDVAYGKNDGISPLGDEYVILDDVMYRATVLARRANQDLSKPQ